MSEKKLLDHLVKVANKSGAIPPIPLGIRQLKESIEALPSEVGKAAMSQVITQSNMVAGIVKMIQSTGSLASVGEFKNILNQISSQLGTSDITKVSVDRLIDVIKTTVSPEELERAVGGAVALASGLLSSVSLPATRPNFGNPEDIRIQPSEAVDDLNQPPGMEVLTSRGDLIYQETIGLERLAIGSNGQMLSVVNNVPEWVTTPSIEFASDAETITGTETAKAVTPASLTAAFGARTAELSYGEIGTYVFARRTTGTTDTAPGSTLAGSSLSPASAVSIAAVGGTGTATLAVGSALSGTWRAMGNHDHSASGGSVTLTSATLWLRIS